MGMVVVKGNYGLEVAAPEGLGFGTNYGHIVSLSRENVRV